MVLVKDSRTLGRALPILGLVFTFVYLCAWPYVRWSASPSLFDDDFLRVGSLRRSTLSEALFRPFNEHMAPLFELVSWIAWQGAGRRIESVPFAFMVASYVAFGLTVGLLGTWIGVELRSRTVALVSIAFFSLSSVSAETVLWYSASSFQWAASASLAALLTSTMAAGSSTKRGQLAWLTVSCLAALCAPSFSAIGILAGPLATLRFLSTADRPESLASRSRCSIAPLLGSGIYLVICERFQYRALVSTSVQRNFSPVAALWSAIEAPSAVLIPALVGWPNLSWTLPGVVLAGFTLIGLFATLIWSVRSRQRPMILCGLALIAGGYLSTFATRARPGDLWIFEIQRYHLFPQLGLIALLAAIAAPHLRRFDRQLAKTLLAGIGVAAILAIPQYPRMQAVSVRAFRYPEQSQALIATSRLEGTCEREGVTLIQAMKALEPIQTRWFPKAGPFNPLLHLFGAGAMVSRLPDSQVRPTLLLSLSVGDREALFGGMEATRYRKPARSFESLQLPVIARLVASERMTSLGAGQYHVDAQPAFLEYEVGPQADTARALCLRGLKVRRALEIWWAGEDGEWSPFRSVRWNPDPDQPAGDWAVAIDVMPHWRRGGVRRLRVVVREWGPIEVQAPRFLP